ncbi:MAG: magnesium transporter, partial [Phototrophicales bacterium]
IYVPNIITVYTYEDKEEVAKLMQRYDLEAVPVISTRGTLLGRITIDDVMDVVKELAEDGQRAMAGISEDIEEDDSIWMLARARLPWLLIGMIGGLLGAQFIGFFDDQLLAVPAMAFFIPLIMATGGNVGIQSSTIVVQTLA